MKVTIFGSGYVGLVTGACLAEVGNEVVCMDVDQSKIDKLKQGIIPIYEPDLDQMVERNMAAGRLAFTTDPKEAVDHGLFQFIAVGTPPDEDGSADLQYVLAVAETIAEHMNDYRIVVDKSTVPVGTAEKVRNRIGQTLQQQGKEIEFDVVSNPEFLKEGAAIEDFMKPDRIVIGTGNPRTTVLLRALYAPFNRSGDRLIAMDIPSSSLLSTTERCHELYPQTRSQQPVRAPLTTLGQMLGVIWTIYSRKYYSSSTFRVPGAEYCGVGSRSWPAARHAWLRSLFFPYTKGKRNVAALCDCLARRGFATLGIFSKLTISKRVPCSLTPFSCNEC